MGAQGSLMHVRNQGWPVWSDPSEELLQHEMLKTLMLTMIDNWQTMQSIVASWVWAYMAADWAEGPCWALCTTKITNNGHMSGRTGSWCYGRRWPGVMNQSYGWPGACASFQQDNAPCKMCSGIVWGRRVDDFKMFTWTQKSNLPHLETYRTQRST